MVCPRGPVVPAWLGVAVPGSRIGGPGAPFGVPAWSRGPGLAWGGWSRIQNRWLGGPVWCARVVPWSRPGFGWVSQDLESVAREPRLVRPRGPVVPLVLWSRLVSLSLALSLLFGVHAPVSCSSFDVSTTTGRDIAPVAQSSNRYRRRPCSSSITICSSSYHRMMIGWIDE